LIPDEGVERSAALVADDGVDVEAVEAKVRRGVREVAATVTIGLARCQQEECTI
jgi:hypothetical protein